MREFIEYTKTAPDGVKVPLIIFGASVAMWAGVLLVLFGIWSIKEIGDLMFAAWGEQ